jgi:hypothetical protein
VGVYDYQSLLAHAGHKIEIVTYGRIGLPPVNVSCECVDCNEVLMDFDAPANDLPNDGFPESEE